MSAPITLEFQSELHAPAERVWEWITSVRGIRAEMWPYFRMTTPRGIRSLRDIIINPGQPMFRSYVFLLGVLPIDYSDMTLLEINASQGFIEESPMGSMKLWRHERSITPNPGEPSSVLLIDKLTFQPRVAAPLVRWFIHRVFTHRHQVLRAHLSGTSA